MVFSKYAMYMIELSKSYRTNLLILELIALD